jgi:hypothetical protein
MVSNYFVDLTERVLASYVYAFITLLLTNSIDLTNLDALKVAAISCVPAALAIIKGALARFVGNPDTASLTD